MAKSPLILAALAKAAVPHVNFHEVKSLSADSNGDFDTALLTANSGEHYVVRVANTQAAGAEQEVELQALKALVATDRMRLPFKVTNLIGETKDDRGNRVLVFEFIYGLPTDIATVGAGSTLASSIAKAIVAIHNLDTAVVENAHLASFEPSEIVRGRIAELDRAAATGKVPAVLLSRWEAALEDVSLFRFKPCVIHGGLNADTVLTLDNEVSGVLGWSTLRISDPAEDFAWIMGSGNYETAENIIDVYRQHHYGFDDALRVRAMLYSELEWSRWLMHGISRKDEAIIAEAHELLQELADDVSTGVVGSLTARKPEAPAAQLVSENYPSTAPIEVPTSNENELF
ncbi:MAG: phosphotransferase [Rhodoluna sp.]